jgi:hypothetical protein
VTPDFLWLKGIEFELEKNKRDLVVNERYIEFKFNYYTCEEALRKRKGVRTLFQKRVLTPFLLPFLLHTEKGS